MFDRDPHSVEGLIIDLLLVNWQYTCYRKEKEPGMSHSERPSFADTVRFHGHSCPGLAIGYRVAVAALEHLGISKPSDDELMCVVENDACGLDAIQLVTSCTAGKGNLVLRDYGKQVYTFYHRPTARALRFSIKMLRVAETEEHDITAIRNRMLSGTASEADTRIWREHKDRKIQLVLQSPEEEVFVVRTVEYEELERARIFDSVWCDACGEKVMGTRTVSMNGRTLCIPCSKG